MYQGPKLQNSTNVEICSKKSIPSFKAIYQQNPRQTNIVTNRFQHTSILTYLFRILHRSQFHRGRIQDPSSVLDEALFSNSKLFMQNLQYSDLCRVDFVNFSLEKDITFFFYIMWSGRGHAHSKETQIVWYVRNVFRLCRPLKGWPNFFSVTCKSKSSKPTFLLCQQNQLEICEKN